MSPIYALSVIICEDYTLTGHSPAVDGNALLSCVTYTIKDNLIAH